MKKSNCNQSTQTRLKTQETEGIKKNYLFIIILFVAFIGGLSPFVHVLFPKTAQEVIQLEENYGNNLITSEVYHTQKKILKEKYSFLGFNNKRRFYYSIGLPISILLCSLLLFYASKYIEEKKVKKGIKLASSVFQFTALYYLIWVFWAYKKGSDFSIEFYYLAIFVTSLLMFFSLRYLKSYYDNSSLRPIVSRLFDYILIDVKEKDFIDKDKKEEYTLSNEDLISEISKNIS